MIRELKIFEIECDICRDKIIVWQQHSHLPGGWKKKYITGSGNNYDYENNVDVCPKCLSEKYEKDN